MLPKLLSLVVLILLWAVVAALAQSRLLPGPLVTAVGAGTTYPDYKPAPFIVSSKIDGVDMVTVVPSKPT